MKVPVFLSQAKPSFPHRPFHTMNNFVSWSGFYLKSEE
jgi:hypothetical protein